MRIRRISEPLWPEYAAHIWVGVNLLFEEQKKFTKEAIIALGIMEEDFKIVEFGVHFKKYDDALIFYLRFA